MGSQAERERLLRQERLILRATEAIWEQMRRKGVRKTDLAESLALSRARITQALDGERNLTLRTFSDFASALGCDVVLDLVPTEFDESALFAERATTKFGRPTYTFDAKDEEVAKKSYSVAA